LHRKIFVGKVGSIRCHVLKLSTKIDKLNFLISVIIYK
jgi:hypothetical protein